jgi:dipeptidyl aminopeptidase/acylaminoacyl peptidase
MKLVVSILIAGTAWISCGPPGQTGPVQTSPPPGGTPARSGLDQEPPRRRTVGSLVFDGAPDVPLELRRRVEPFLSTQPSELLDVAPDGRAILVGKRAGDAQQVHRIDRPGATPVQLTSGPDRAQSARFVPGGAGAIVYAADRAGDERVQIFRVDPAGPRVTRLTDGTSRNVGHVLSPEGTRLAWASNARNGRDYDIWLSDGKRAESAALVLPREGTWAPLGFTREGRRLLIRRYLSPAESELHLVDLATRKVTPVRLPGGPAAYRAAKVAPDGRSVYTAVDGAGEFRSLHQIELATRRGRPLSSGIPWDVEEMALSPGGRTVAFVTNEDGWSRLHVLDLRSGQMRRVPGVPDGVVRGLTFATAADVLGFTAETAAQPPAAYTLDLRTQQLTRWTDGEMGDLTRSDLVAPTLIRYPTFDGREIPGLYYRPRGSGRFPVLIDIHGGPEGQSRPEFGALTQYLASAAGWAVLQPNVRGSDGYGKTYLGLDNGRGREHAVRDIGTLLDWITRQPELDPARVVVMGASYGGYMVLASMVHFGDRLAGGIELAGSSNFLTLLASVPDELRDVRRRELGDERDPATRDFLHDISPLTHADRIRDPLFVAQGQNDRRVVPAESEQIVAALRRNGTPVWYLVALDEGHGFVKKPNRDTFMCLSILFLETFVK